MIDQLRRCYTNFHATAYLPKGLARRASPPLLVYPHERWHSASVRLLIVGQETRRWAYKPFAHGDEGRAINTFRDFAEARRGVEYMLKLYRQYALGRIDSRLNSPFWRGFRALDLAITGIEDTALWTNIFKMNIEGSVKRNCRAREVLALEHSQRGLFLEEISILEPDAVVFLTGPDYDDTLQREFADVKILPISDQISTRALAAIRSPDLPTRSIRTFHPEYLQRSRQLGLLRSVSDWIATG